MNDLDLGPALGALQLKVSFKEEPLEFRHYYQLYRATTQFTENIIVLYHHVVGNVYLDSDRDFQSI